MAARIAAPSRVPPPARTLARRLALALMLAALCGCATSTAPIDASPQTGIVRMRPDRSLEVRLLAGEHGGRVDGVRIVAPEHRDYAAILAGTGPMQPGDQRPYRGIDAGE